MGAGAHMDSGGVVIGSDHAEGLVLGVFLPDGLQGDPAWGGSLGPAVHGLLWLYGSKLPCLHN